MKSVDPNLSKLPFGGKTIVLGGDFRQCLPVVLRGQRADIVQASIKFSYLWKYARVLKLTTNMRLAEGQIEYRDFLLKIGNDQMQKQTINEIPDCIKLPENICLPLNINTLVDKIYDNFQQQHNQPQYINDRAILCPLNIQADEINTFISNKIQAESHTYLSIDTILDENNDNHNAFNTEFLNSLDISGLPKHRLDSKINNPIILMRNLSNANGLCNGTRMIITSN